MCAQQNNSCEGCSLYDDGIECPVEGPPEGWKLNMLAEYERIVMDWAAKNPEPRYPSWIEWQGANFQMAERAICAAHFMDAGDAGCYVNGRCDKCREQPIPADIAEKLGIKPIGGTEDA
jgi:hypothetical protein